MIGELESREAAAERRYDEMLQEGGQLKCNCGTIFDPENEGGTLSPDPFALPVCNDCLVEYFGDRE